MRLKQERFYRQVGVRRREHLVQPRLLPQTKLQLPLETVYHYRPEDSVVTGPSPQDPLLQELNTRVFIEHITELAAHQGGPRRTVNMPAMMIREYRQRNRGFKRFTQDRALVVNPKYVLVENYAILPSLFRYMNTRMARYYRWRNFAQTVWTNVQAVHERFEWNQYLELSLPEVIPSTSAFVMAKKTLTSEVLKAFPNNDAFDLLDLYLWLGDNREESTLNVLTKECLNKVNLVVRVLDRFFVLNLGVIDGWRKDKDDEEDEGTVEGTLLQRKFVRLLHGLRDLKAGVTQVGDDTTSRPDEDDSPAGPEDNVPAFTPPTNDEPVTPAASRPATDTSDPLALPDLGDDDDLTLPPPITDEAPTYTVPTPTPDDTEEDTLPQVDGPSVLEDPNYEPPADQPESGVERRARMYEQAGILSPKAAQRAVEDAKRYQDLPDPYGSGKTLGEAMTVTPEDLALPETTPFPDRDTVLDKSMLTSNLHTMQTTYNKNVLHKDVMSSVMGIQQLGISVKDYQVETVENSMDHYQIHTLTLKPVRGKQSTVRFRLPVVREDGRFVSNGTEYRMRLQRAD